MTVDATLAAVAASGWSVNNVFQTQDGSWRANLRRPSGFSGHDDFVEFGHGSTLLRALTSCIDKMGGLSAPAPAPEDLL